MFEKNLTIEYLLDFYGEVLDEHTKKILSAYYGEDLSLSEIASEIGISRQGVRHVLKKGEEILFSLEEKLGLAKRHQSDASLIESIKALAAKLGEAGDEKTRLAAQEILSLSEKLAE